MTPYWVQRVGGTEEKSKAFLRAHGSVGEDKTKHKCVKLRRQSQRMQQTSHRSVYSWCQMSLIGSKCSEIGRGGILEIWSGLGGLLGGGSLAWSLRYPAVLQTLHLLGFF